LEKAVENTELTHQQASFAYYVACGYSDVKAYMLAYDCGYDNARRHAHGVRKNGDVFAENDGRL